MGGFEKFYKKSLPLIALTFVGATVKLPALPRGASPSTYRVFPPPRWGRIKVGVMPFFTLTPTLSRQGRGSVFDFLRVHQSWCGGKRRLERFT